jgi:hypothetical protein
LKWGEWDAGGTAFGTFGGGVGDVDEDVAALGADVVTTVAEFLEEVGFELDVEDEVVGSQDEEDEGQDPEEGLVEGCDGGCLVDEDFPHGDCGCPQDDDCEVEEDVAWVSHPGAGGGAEDQVLVLHGDPELGVRQDGGEVRHRSW